MCVSFWKKIAAICLGVLAGIGLLCGCQPEAPNPDTEVVELTFKDSAIAGIDYSRFTDVAGHPAEAYIKAVSLLGIARGRTDTKFAPDAYITRAEFTEMVAYASGLTAASYKDIYTDVNAAYGYAGILQAAHTAGLIDTSFVTGSTFNGDALITRAEIASMLSAGYKQLTGKEVTSDIITDLTANTPEGNMTRADAATLIFDLQDKNSKMFQWSFDSNLSGWQSFLRTAATTKGKTNAKGKTSWTSADGHNASGCMLFDLEYTGMNQINCFWWQYNASGKNGGNLLEKGKTYLLTFYAKVEGDADAVSLNVAKFRSYTDNNEEYSNLCSGSLSGDGWQLYCMEFTATTTVKEAQLIFQAGGCDNFNTKIYIDDIALQAFDKSLGVQAAAENAYKGVAVITGSGRYTYSQNANLIAGGRKADGEYYLPYTWIDSEYGNVVGLGSLYNSPVTKHRIMEVSYQKFTVPEKNWGFAASGYTADIQLYKVSRSSGNVSVSAKLSVPQGFELVDVGILYYGGSYADNFSVFTEGAVIVRPDAIAADGSFQVAQSGYAATSAVLVKGYAICKDANENYIIFYSNDKVTTAEKNPAEIDYEMIYNLEMLYLFVHCDPSSDTDWSDLVERIATTDTDMITLTPQACRTHLWNSEKYSDFKDLDPSESNAHRVYNTMKEYIQSGKDPFQEMLDLFRENGFDTVFVDYRMNEKQQTDKENHPFHNPFYLEHKEYWLNPDSKQNNRVFNYMVSAVREYYFGILTELVTNYDVDGLSLDFERAPIFFKSEEVEEGTQVMTDFVGRIRAMLDEVGEAKGKYLPLGVRVPSSMEKALSVGLDVAEWVERGYVDYVNATSSYWHTLNVDVESYIDAVGDDVKVYGELQFTVYEKPDAVDERVYCTAENIRSVAESFYARGVDGISVFNMDYSQNVPQALLGITGITDRKTDNEEKHYVLKTGYDYTIVNQSLTATPYLAVNSANFDYALLRIRTDVTCKNASFNVNFNGHNLELARTIKLTDKTELFPRITNRSQAYPTSSYVKYYVIPLNLIKNGENKIEINQTSGTSCKIELIDIGIYHEDSYALQGLERTP